MTKKNSEEKHGVIQSQKNYSNDNNVNIVCNNAYGLYRI